MTRPTPDQIAFARLAWRRARDARIIYETGNDLAYVTGAIEFYEAEEAAAWENLKQLESQSS